MSHPSRSSEPCPLQEAIRARCFHPSGNFVEFRKEEIEQSIPSRFEQMVRRYPDRIAVKTKHDQLTYCELNKAANRVARAIIAQRGGEKEPVALLLEQGSSLVAGILGVLKAAKLYVSLDASHPCVRNRYIFEDSQAGLIVTDSKGLPLAAEIGGNECELLNLDELDLRFGDENPGLPLSPHTLAYIQYTSGSTGQPKGVLQNHRNVLHSVMTYTNGLHISADDRFSPVRNWFIALLNGAAACLFDVKKIGLAALAHWLIQEEITMFFSIPSVFRHFIESLTVPEKFPTLRLIHLEGEAVTKRDVDLCKQHFSPDCILVNRLAATETGSIRWYFVDNGTQIEATAVPAGYAVEDKEVLLLDEAGQEIGFNQVGQIAVKSGFLALGYWRKPDLTRAAFLPDTAGGNARIYLTGDLGRMQPDGCLEYLGRKDSQVKIRGNRVELAEIEMALLGLPAIKEAVVVSSRDRFGEERPVAYIVAVRGFEPVTGELRSFLRERLPEYMIPSVFMFLEALPLLPNGKVDRRALPSSDSVRPELEKAFIAPCSPVEGELARIWSEVLRLERVGVNDNFFDLGGHSLLATRVICQVREVFHVEIPLRVLFQNPTVTGVAIEIAKAQAKTVAPEDMAGLLSDLESLSDEEAKRLLNRETIEKVLRPS